MSPFRHLRRLLSVLPVVAATALLSAAQQRTTPKFYDDDPIARAVDTQDASKTAARERSLYYDALANLFGRPGEAVVGRAADVNTIDEVPDSSWYTNRAVTPEQILRGVDEDTGPAAGQWQVSHKTNGASAGFTITDPKDRKYFLKFDPPGNPELGTGAEAVVTRLFYALGYNVPQSNIIRVRRQDLSIGKNVTIKLPGGRRRPMRQSDLDDELRDAHRDPDGSYRAVAGSAVSAVPDALLEGFRYEGTRPDDPNDVIPHEDRRELRGLRVFAAWVNHTDAKAINSMDARVREGGKEVVHHYLIDFNATLGSAGIGLRERRDGYEYLAEPGRAAANLPTLGFHPRRWMLIDYPRYRGIGRFEAADFRPEEWRPRVPNPAFIRSRPDDLFWAARKLAALREDVIRAAVKAGRYSDPKAEKYLGDALIERRNRIARAWLTTVNPIVDPELGTTGWLTFHNAAVDLAGASRPSGYKAVWHRFDNASGEVTRITETTGTAERIRVPDGLPDAMGSFIRVDVAAAGAPDRSWEKPVHLYFKRAAQGWKLVGLYRMPDAPPMRPGLIGAEAIKAK
jgi:hypothetical protein